jgi:phosphomevalonate kinase
MTVAARAPGKLVVLGEYAVLAGGPALVMAVDRHCTVTVGPAAGPLCTLETYAPERVKRSPKPGAATGVGIVDAVLRAFPHAGADSPWSARLDSRAFFANGVKLGLGSSAAALVAFAAAWTLHGDGSEPPIDALIECHRAHQGGTGSGLDVAAAVTGGVIQYRIAPTGRAEIGSVRLPNSVGFAGVFTGVSAKTPDFVEQFERWRSARSAESELLVTALKEASEAGCAAAREGDAQQFLAAVERYRDLLDGLGRRIGREIVTAHHHEVGALARRYGVVYKTSGAGGGDLGIAFCEDRDALGAFGKAVKKSGFDWVEFGVDQDGLIIEERT